MVKELKPVIVKDSWSEPLRAEINRIFRILFFEPLLLELEATRDNALPSKNVIIKALQTGNLVYTDNLFKGGNASTSKALKEYGAIFSVSKKGWSIPLQKLPKEIQDAVNFQIEKAIILERHAREAISRIKDTAMHIMPKVSFQNLSRAALLKIKEKVRITIPNEISVQPKLEDDTKLTQDYTDNVKLSIVGFIDEEVLNFRNKIMPKIRSGMGRKDLQKYVEARLEVGKARAKFIAGQETRLFTSKLKEVQYQQAGIEEYRWKAIGGKHGDGRTRQSHMEAHGKIFYYNKDKNDEGVYKPRHSKGGYANPGQDFNCRCQDIPIVRNI